MPKYVRKDLDSITKMSNWITASIVNTVLGTSIPIPTMPSSVSESFSLNTNEQQIVARWAPIVSYASTGARNVTLSFSVFDEYLPSGYSNIADYVNNLKALEYPNYRENEVVVPQCVLTMANLKLTGIVTSVSISWGGKISGAVPGGTFTIANISLQFKEVSNSVKGAIQVKGGA